MYKVYNKKSGEMNIYTLLSDMRRELGFCSETIRRIARTKVVNVGDLAVSNFNIN